MNLKIIHRDSDIGMQARYVEGASQVFISTVATTHDHGTDDNDGDRREAFYS